MKWLKWDASSKNGPTELQPYTTVYVKFRNGSLRSALSTLELDWTHRGWPDDIVEYSGISLENEKLTTEQARDILAQAIQDIEKYPMLRMGQALWNVTPAKIALRDVNHPNHAQWYNSVDAPWCVERFFNDLVEQK